MIGAGAGMTSGQKTVLHIFEHLQAQHALDDFVARRWPHDVYMQTVAVMGYDPLPEPVVIEQDDGAANVMQRD